MSREWEDIAARIGTIPLTDAEWLEHIWEMCRTNGFPLERAHYVFGLNPEEIQQLKEIDEGRTVKVSAMGGER